MNNEDLFYTEQASEELINKNDEAVAKENEVNENE